MGAGSQLSDVAALIGDPGRASMLALLMDGHAHMAGELAAAAGVTAQTASGHLAKMRDGNLVTAMAQGRRRYYQLASDEVASMLEGIMQVAAGPETRKRATPRIPVELREARTCYDHLAGRLGIAIIDSLTKQGVVTWNNENCQLTARDHPLLSEMGIDLAGARGASRRPECRPCLDWSEQRPHLAGVFGKALLERILALGWIERLAGTRAVRITPLGGRELLQHFAYAQKA